MSMLERFKNSGFLSENLLDQKIIRGDGEVAKAFADAGEVVEFQPGTILIKEGDVDRDMYFLLFGKVALSVKSMLLYTREKWQTVGEMSAINPLLTRTATVTAIELTIALKVSPEILEKVAATQPKVYLLIARELSNRLEQRNSLIRPPNERPRVFFISSKESLEVAKAIRHGLRYSDTDSALWSDDHIFPPGAYPLEVLEREVDIADFGVAIAHPDDIVHSRDRKTAAPRDNVLFELGFFMSRLRRDRTFLLVPNGGPELKMPSDFKGLTPIGYTPLTGEKSEVPGNVLTSTVYELEQRIRRLGCRLL